MMKLTKTVFRRTLWAARGTATMMGLAVMLALVAGVASTALAGTGVGAAFNLGQTNTVNAISKLVGSVTGSSLTIDNNSSAATATALDLQVEPGKDPMKVNSQAKVENLNVDKLDGKDSTQFLGNSDKAANSDKLDGVDSFDFLQENERDDFLPSSTYIEDGTFVDGPGGGVGAFTGANCDQGDVAIGGGGVNIGVEDDMNNSLPSDTDTWSVEWQDNGSPGTFQASVHCADFPPLR